MNPRYNKFGHTGQIRGGDNLRQPYRERLQVQMTVGIDQTGTIFGLQNLFIGIHCHRP